MNNNNIEGEILDIKKMLKMAVKNNDWDYVYEAIDFIDEYIDSYTEDEELEECSY